MPTSTTKPTINPITHLIFTLAITFFTLSIFPHPTHAQFTLSISPPLLQVLLKPQTSFTKAFTLYNPTSSPLTLIPRLYHTTLTSTDGLLLPNLNRPFNPSSEPITITLENAQLTLNQPFTLPPHSQNQIVLRLTSAKISNPQDIYLALVFTSPTPTPHLLTPIQPLISLPLLITISPDTQLPLNLSLTHFSPPHLHDSTTPLTLTPQVHNLTPHMTRLQGTFTITNWRRRQILSRPLYPHLILGHSSRTLQLDTPDHTPTPLTWSPSPFSFGLYTLTLTLTSSGGKTILSQSQTIFLAPLQYLIYLLLTLLTLLIFLLPLRHHHRSS